MAKAKTTDKIGNAILKDTTAYIGDVKYKIRKKANKYAEYMVNEARDRSPVSPDSSLVGDEKPHFYLGWTKGRKKLKNGGMLYGAKNTMYPQMTHLLAKPHDHKSWGLISGPEIQPHDNSGHQSEWIDEISAKYQAYLDADIEKILKG